MKLVKIKPFENGAHDNCGYSHAVAVSDGWAVIPDGMVCENFPFGEITVDDSTPPVVTSWTPLPMPEPEPEPGPEEEPSVWDELDAAYTAGYKEGVNTAYDQ